MGFQGSDEVPYILGKGWRGIQASSLPGELRSEAWML